MDWVIKNNHKFIDFEFMGLDYFFSERVVLRSEVFWDNYSKVTAGGNTDVPGALAFINVLPKILNGLMLMVLLLVQELFVNQVHKIL